MEGIGGGFKFNEGIYQMERIHTLQSQLNFCKNLPLLKDTNTGIYGFQTWFSLLNSLCLEFASKLKEDELEEVTEKRKEVKESVLKVLIFKRDMNGKILEGIDKNVWQQTEELLFEYELMIKKLMVKHKISSPDAQDPSKSVIN